MSKKISVTLAICLLVISGIWIWSLVMPKNYVILGGSTSVNPFMQLYTNDYEKYEGADFIYNSTGSQAGVSGVEKHMYGAGFISKNATSKDTLSPTNSFYSFEGEDLEFVSGEGTQFKEQLKTIISEDTASTEESYVALEFAIDAILVIYNPPTWFSQAGLDKKLDFKIDKSNFSETLLGKIYANNFSWEKLATELGGTPPSSNTSFNTFTREDGSGTRSAFSDVTGIKKMDSANVVNSNGAMLDNIEKSSGSIGFVSYAFISQIDGSTPVRVAGINGIKLGNLADNSEGLAMQLNEVTNTFELMENQILNEEVIKNGVYKFQRPFIAIFNLHNSQIQAIIRFFSIMIGIDQQDEWVENAFVKEGLVQKFTIKHL